MRIDLTEYIVVGTTKFGLTVEKDTAERLTTETLLYTYCGKMDNKDRKQPIGIKRVNGIFLRFPLQNKHYKGVEKNNVYAIRSSPNF